ncbi:hypothetical protein MIS46_01545 [Wielerella bovis]|uniref:hypothetical protein n=1 Tax=Wielerella bovis TaxID=2917790 RepID=UPI0020196047|nr:hypothetical protein [Wielerella bovis]ULJ62793.1 hypothetical protein MIS46_01545 [Wielerella bovis]
MCQVKGSLKITQCANIYIINQHTTPHTMELDDRSLFILLFTFVLMAIIVFPTMHKLRQREKQLGYPKEHETLDDVRFLVAINEEILAQSCFRRVTGGSLKQAKAYIEQIKQQPKS